MEGGWSLGAWIEHARAQREADLRYLEARVEMIQAEVRHGRDMAALQKEMNDIHFEQLNENAKRTIEERGHFVSHEAFGPFREAVQKYMATHEGKRAGVSATVSWAIGVGGFVVGMVGTVVAILALGGP